MRVESFLPDSKKINSALKKLMRIVGDVNTDGIKNKSSLSVNQYIKILTSFGLKIKNSEPTRESKISKTSIDHPIAKREKKVETVKTSISDHYGCPIIFLIIHRKNNNKRKKM